MEISVKCGLLVIPHTVPVICILRRLILEPLAKPSQAKPHALCEVPGTLWEIFKNLVQVFQNFCHLDVNYMLRNGISITETTNSSSF